MTHPHWPLWDLRIRTPRLELRPVRESEMADLSELIDGGIHDPATMPFLIPFTDAPNPQRAHDSYRFWMGCWAGWSVESWRLVLAAYSDGRCVGSQDVQATDFPTLRTVTTGSWLGLPHQGHGLGREMRAAVLQLAFEGLGAQRAATEAFEDNVETARSGALEFGHKTLDIAKTNSDATFAFAKELLAAKTFAEALELQTGFAKKQFETLTAQFKEVQELSQKLATEASRPLKASYDKAVKGAKFN